jgi:hypothetical protein
LLIDVLRDPAVCVPEEFLRSLDINTVLAKHGCQAMTEAVPTDSLRHSDLFQHRPNMTPESHVR